MERRTPWGRAITLALLALGLEGCATGGGWLRLSAPASPHDAYVEALERSGRDELPAAQAWIADAQASLRRARPITLPRHLEAVVEAGRAAAATTVAFTLPEGRRLAIDVRPDTLSPGQLFVDVFAVPDEEEPRRVASLLPDSLTVSYEAGREVPLIVRVQPSLEWSGRYVITPRTEASLPFPVQGLTARAVQSGFGVDRDAGRRLHEGIDIFAPRGTPVVAVASGIAQPATNGLGGTVVWLHEPDARRTFYYAHLDRHAFEAPRRVVVGEVLGYVGNSGNARTTTPHLHFGLYQDGPRDPLPYVAADDVVPPLPGRRAAETQ